MEYGYRWYIRIKCWGEHEPNETTFATFEDAIADGLSHRYSLEEIGVDYCSIDDGWVEIIRRVQMPQKDYCEDEGED